jgi:hypothetical protein
MTDDVETIQVTCPLCRKKHEYRLRVERSMVIYHMASTLPTTQKTIKRFTRIFTCPEKNEHFEAILRLEEGFGFIIKDVSVL